MPDTDKKKEEIIAKFSEANVLVIGDIMLDRYLWGSVNRISPEAPVPIVKVEKTSLVLGGAANVAANIVGLGGNVILFGVKGDDTEADALSDLLVKSGISSEYLIRVKNRPTTIKTRIVAHNQHVVRIDQETNNCIEEEISDEIFRNIVNLRSKFSTIVLSDYAKGILTEKLISRLIKLGKSENKFVLVDPKGKNYTKYKGATLLTPNQRETLEAFGFEESTENLAENLAEKAGKHLLEKLSLEGILITQGEMGMTLLQNNKGINENNAYLKATARKVYDVTGAGDTVIAVMATALAVGANFRQAAEIANLAAGLVVEKVGTTIITREMIWEHLKIPKTANF
ncbi:MAG: D-glycero-beta-D-manno-heptose-7-phosphate kinase [Acidobacteriota bacterium]|nr:D-glycero-beta-D-manno-heptose-7-phosphate kinase [Acidobacteriota bacterium]